MHVSNSINSHHRTLYAGRRKKNAAEGRKTKSLASGRAVERRGKGNKEEGKEENVDNGKDTPAISLVMVRSRPASSCTPQVPTCSGGRRAGRRQ